MLNKDFQIVLLGSSMQPECRKWIRKVAVQIPEILNFNCPKVWILKVRVPHILHAFLIHYLVSCQPPAEIPAISNRAEEEEDKPSQVLLFWSPKDPFSVPSIQSTVTHQRGAVQSKSMAQGLVERGGVHSWALRSAQGRGAADPSPVCSSSEQLHTTPD